MNIKGFTTSKKYNPLYIYLLRGYRKQNNARNFDVQLQCC